MYSVSAHINDVSLVTVPLDPTPGAEFPLRIDTINAALSVDKDIKLVYICSPGNPTGALVDPDHIKALLNHPTWNGILAIDEAYVDFAGDSAGLAHWVTAYPNLVVMQTLSKAFGLAGIRFGTAFCSTQVAQLLNSMKAPYNISTPTSILASTALQPQSLALIKKNIQAIFTQRQRLLVELPQIPGVGIRGGADANFLLVEILGKPNPQGVRNPDNSVASKLYQRLAETMGVVVRFRGNEAGCVGCLRISVGTDSENTTLLHRIRECLEHIYAEDASC